MHGPSLIVAERGETDKKVSADVDASLCLTLACLRGPGLVMGGAPSPERKRILKTALFALVLPCSQVLHELNCDET
jgi:hypothetical protein